MPEHAWLAVSLVASVIGVGWLALALDAHWDQAFGAAPLTRATRRTLRVFGAAALAFSMSACFLADHPTMAPLTWIMGLAVAAVVVAFLLAYRPRVLAWLVLPRPRPRPGDQAGLRS